VVELGEVGGYGELVGIGHVLRVEKGGDAQLVLGGLEGQRVVFEYGGRLQRVEVDEVRPEMVDDGAEGEAVAEGGGQVGDVDVGVGRGDPLAPDLQRAHAFPLYWHSEKRNSRILMQRYILSQL
jgi:hypothetical protein